jgi:hypothetical protein
MLRRGELANANRETVYLAHTLTQGKARDPQNIQSGRLVTEEIYETLDRAGDRVLFGGLVSGLAGKRLDAKLFAALEQPRIAELVEKYPHLTGAAGALEDVFLKQELQPAWTVAAAHDRFEDHFNGVAEESDLSRLLVNASRTYSRSSRQRGGNPEQAAVRCGLAVVFDPGNVEACHTALAIVDEFPEDVGISERLVREVTTQNPAASVRYYLDTAAVHAFRQDRGAAQASLDKAANLVTPEAIPDAEQLRRFNTEMDSLRARIGRLPN